VEIVTTIPRVIGYCAEDDTVAIRVTVARETLLMRDTGDISVESLPVIEVPMAEIRAVLPVPG
jgi:hypothetical protein